MAKRKYPTNAGIGRVTRAIPAPTTTQQNPIDLMMSARLARQLGISPVTFWRWRKMEDFPAGRRIRNHVYFSQSAVLAWLDRQQQVV